MTGSRRSRPRSSDDRRRILATIAVLAVLGGTAQAEDGLTTYTVVGDGIPASLTGAAGDPVQGRAIVTNREVGLCVLCHSGPFPEVHFQGTLAPNLADAGDRATTAQLRLRIVDAARLNPATIMPPYYRTNGLSHVAPAFRGKPILSAARIEDVVAYLTTLREAK